MKRILAGLLVLVLLAGTAAALWYFRPWSDYSPARIAAMDDPEQYPATFQRMDEILPARTIAAGDPLPFERALRDLDTSYEFDGETRSLDDFAGRGDVIGLAVLSGGDLVFERYWRGADDQTRFTSWSVGKSFIATLIFMALEDGLIDSLDEPAAKYAPQFADSDYGDVTLRHLLMMSAGVDFNEEYSPGAPSDVRPLFFNAFILGRDPDAMIARIEQDRAPGEDFHYVSPNSHVLSAVLRGVHGAPLHRIVERELWTPLGMEADASWLQQVPGEDGVAIGYCCLQARTVDFARLGQLYLQDGAWNGETLFAPEWAEAAGVPPEPYMEPDFAPEYGGRGYGLHFWVPENYDGEFFAAGVYGQYIWIDRRRDVVVAINSGDADWGARSAEARALMRALAEAAADTPGETGDDGDAGDSVGGDGDE